MAPEVYLSNDYTPKRKFTYMAPEIYSSEDDERQGYYGLKADIYSLGIILFILNFGTAPWQEPNLMTDRMFNRF